MRQPLVSAVIPAYNAAGLIGEAIDSILRQTYSQIEIIVVDDGSQDRTAEFVRRRYPDVKVIQQQNAGPSAARNAGADAASGEVLAFLDADDWWAPEKTERQLDALLESDADAVGTNGLYVYDWTEYLHATLKRPRLFEVTLRYGLFRGWPVGASLMLPKAVFAAISGYNAGIGARDDIEIYYRILVNGYRLFMLNEPLYLIRCRSGSRSSRSIAARCEANLAALETVDPSQARDGGQRITAAEYGFLRGEEVLRGAWAALEDDDPERAAELLERLDEIERLTPRTRLLWSLSRTSWPLFVRAFSVDRSVRHFQNYTKWWGLIGGLRRRRQMAAIRQELQKRSGD